MTDPTANPPDPATPHIVDISEARFRFDTKLWFEAPDFGASDPNDKELFYRRQANDNLYRSTGNPTKWNRFTTLAYYALDDGMKFDKEWEKIDTDPHMIHRIIWYNYMYHIDRDMDVVPKLNAWANQISHHYLLANDPDSIDMDTMKYAFKDLTNQSENMEVDQTTKDGEWIPVPDKGGVRNRNKNNGAQQEHTPTLDTGMSSAPGFNLPPEETSRPQQTQTQKDNDVTPPTQATITQLPPTKPTKNDQPAGKQKGQLLKDPQPRPSSHVASSTNDGTHRLTVKWTVPKETNMEELEHNRAQMETTILNIIQSIFEDSDGHFYRWESDNLTQRDVISNMTPEVFREYVSPSITSIPSRQQLIFGLRVGFTTNPVAWKTREKREIMDKAQIQVLISNSRCNSGKIVTAGYILLKAANTTHRHRYTQHLREHLPTTTPYFDVLRAIKSPMDQIIPHLAIQCGENHVTTVCQALSTLLTGKKTAIFLPRYALQTMTDTQMQQHFEFHDKWAKSLAPILMGPTIMHLDQPRLEYFADGTTQERSTREWATSLTLPDGTTPALCDTVNGTNDRQAYLVAPRHYLEAAQKQWSEYRSRLSPPRHREARFHDSVPNLPNTTHINTEVQANVNFLERMSAAEIWRQAPAAIRAETQAAPAKEQRLPPPPREAPQPPRNKQSDNNRSTKGDNETANSETHQSASRASASSSLATEDDNDSTDSTQELTRASQNTYQARFHTQAKMFKSQQKAIESLGKTSSDRLSLIERQLHRFEAFDTKLSAVGSQMEQVSNNQQTLTDSLRAIKKDNKAEKTKTRELQDHSDKKIDALSQTVANAMTAILGMGEQFKTISEQVFKISVQLENQSKSSTNTDINDKRQQTANVASDS